MSGASSNIIKNPFETLVNEILVPLSETGLALALLLDGNASHADINIEMGVTDEKKATADMAFITFMLSQYHKDYRKNGAAARFNVSVGKCEPISFFCMKNYTFGGKEKFLT